MRLHPIHLSTTSAARRVALTLAAVVACALPPAAAAQTGSDMWFAHRMAAADAAVFGSLAGLRLAQLADTTDDDAAGYDNAHVTLSEDEARADADLRMAVAVVQLALPAAPQPGVLAPWLDVNPAARLAIVLPTDIADWAKLTVRLATQPGLELDVGVLGGSAIAVRDARLRGAGGSANLSVQTDVVELEWRQGRGVSWTSVQIGVQPQGVVAARLVASIGL